MRFEITATNQLDQDQPCAGAVDEPRVRTYRTRHEYVRWEDWLLVGFNHRRENDDKNNIYWVREEIEHHWFIDLTDLEALLALTRETGCPIIVFAEGTLEIYDGYRE